MIENILVSQGNVSTLSERHVRMLRNVLSQTISIPIRVPAYQEYLLQDIVSERYGPLGNLLLIVERDGNAFLVSDTVLNLYGIGETLESAANEFVSMLTDLYEELSSAEEDLSFHLSRQLNYLRTIISQR